MTRLWSAWNHALFIMTEYDQPDFVWEVNLGDLYRLTIFFKSYVLHGVRIYHFLYVEILLFSSEHVCDCTSSIRHLVFFQCFQFNFPT